MIKQCADPSTGSILWTDSMLTAANKLRKGGSGLNYAIEGRAGWGKTTIANYVHELDPKALVVDDDVILQFLWNAMNNVPTNAPILQWDGDRPTVFRAIEQGKTSKDAIAEFARRTKMLERVDLVTTYRYFDGPIWVVVPDYLFYKRNLTMRNKLGKHGAHPVLSYAEFTSAVHDRTLHKGVIGTLPNLGPTSDTTWKAWWTEVSRVKIKFPVGG